MPSPDVVQSQLEAAQVLGLVAASTLGGAIALPLGVHFRKVSKADAPPWIVWPTVALLLALGTGALSLLSYERRLYVGESGARVARATLLGEQTEGVIPRAEIRRVTHRRWTGVRGKNVPIRGRSLIIEGPQPLSIDLAQDDERIGRDIASRLGVPFQAE